MTKCACNHKYCTTYIELVDNDLMINDEDSSIGIILSSENIDEVINMLVELKNNPNILNSKRLGYGEDGSKFGDE